MLQPLFDLVRPTRSRRATSPHAGPPTIFHVTHHKAGSQWIHRIFHRLVYDRLVLPGDDDEQFLLRPVQPGKVYPTLYVTREQFCSVPVPPDSRRFVVIRDLRDTLVSAYFSIRYSHPPVNGRVPDQRGALAGCGAEDGLLLLMQTWLSLPAQVQWSWAAGREPLIRYEDLLDNDLEVLESVLLDRCELGVSRERLREAVRQYRFENWTGGRPRGQEDQLSHERKGIAGDWRNYFTAKVAAEFKYRFGSVLIATGYERDFNW